MDPLATVATLEGAWRPLSAAERAKAEYWLGRASRRVRSRWPDVDDRIASGQLQADSVADVVVDMVLAAIDGPSVRGAKSFSESAGPMSQSVTMHEVKRDPLAFEDWMIEVFERLTPAVPVYCMPPSGRYESAFIWPEERP